MSHSFETAPETSEDGDLKSDALNEDEARAQLIHSAYQLALDPHFYDAFMVQWDDHISDTVSALNELRGKASIGDPELIAHFDRAFRILEKLERKPPEVLQKRGRKEERTPRLLIGEDGTIIWHNRAAARAFELSQPATIEDISPFFLDPNFRDRLLIELPSEARGDADAIQLLCVEIDDKPLFLIARAVHGLSSELAILLDPLVGEWNPEAGSLLARGFGLTEAEIQVAASLVEGNTPTEIAEKRAVSLSTVRSQLKALLAKTGAANQTDLVRVLASLSHTIQQKEIDQTFRQKSTYLTPSRRHIPVEFYGASKGPAVLFLHGMLDGLSSTPRIDLEFKRHGLRVIAPARPSFGGATPIAEHASAVPSKLAKDIEWLLDQLQIREVQLLGHMAGGFYAFALAAQLGDRVKRIVNVAGAVPIVSTAQFAKMSRRQRLLAYTARYTPSVLPLVVRAAVRLLDSNGEQAFIRALYEDSSPDLATVSERDVFSSVQRGYRFTIAQGHRAFLTDAYHIVRDWSELVRGSAAPVTLIHGRSDPVVRCDTVESFAQRLGARAELQVLENCGQLVLYSEPERVCRAFTSQ